MKQKTCSVWAVAPSSPFSPEKYQEGTAWLLSAGFKIEREAILREHASLPYLNGTDEERLAELQAGLNSDCDFVWVVRGGYGLTRILDDLTFSTHKKQPILVGLSDVTALMLHAWKKTKQKSVHAPSIARISQEPSESLEVLKMILNGQARKVVYPSLQSLSETQVPEEVKGDLIPCNLSMLSTLIGTSSMPSLSGTILMLEDVTETPYRIDRMLTHLHASGVLKGVKAVVLGHFTQCGEVGPVFKERMEVFQIPLLGSLPAGHEPPNWALPFGVKAMLKKEAGQVQLKILEEVMDTAS